MISALAMCLEASTAKRIINTAPIAKFGATKALPGPRTFAQRLDVEAGRPDHDVHAGLDAGNGIAQRDVGRA